MKKTKSKAPLPLGGTRRVVRQARDNEEIRKLSGTLGPGLVAHTEYKRIGIALAEAMGYKMDEQEAAEKALGTVTGGLSDLSPAVKRRRAVRAGSRKVFRSVATGGAEVVRSTLTGLTGGNRVDLAHTEPEAGEKMDEYAALAGVLARTGTTAAIRTGGSTAARRGAVGLGRGAPVKSLRRRAAAGLRGAALDPVAMERLAQAGGQVAGEGVTAALQRRERRENQSTTYNNAYVNKLMESRPVRRGDPHQQRIDRGRFHEATPEEIKAERKRRLARGLCPDGSKPPCKEKVSKKN